MGTNIPHSLYIYLIDINFIQQDLRCTRLWCTNVSPTGDDAGCRTQHMPWADGTKCGPHKVIWTIVIAITFGTWVS